MRRSKKVALAAALAALALNAAAARDERPFLGLDLFVGTPSSADDFFRAAFPGLSLRFRPFRRVEFSVDYAFLGFEYYYPESPSGPWKGPVEWSSMPSRLDGLRSEWIFYQTRHFIAPQVWYLASLERYGQPLAVRVGLGPAFSLVLPGQSAHYYPGLSDAFEQFEKDFDIHPGWSFRLGLEYRPRRLDALRFGAEYLFLIDSASAFASGMEDGALEYADKAGNLLVFAGLRL